MSRLSTLKAEFEAVREGIQRIERAATEAGRDLSDDEQADVDKLYERAAALKPEIEKESDKLDSLTAVSNILARTNVAAPAFHRATEPQEMTAGEFISNALKVQAGMMSREEHIERAARYFRAPDQQSTTDTTGLLPTAIVGNLLSLFDASRSVFNSFASRPMPRSGKTFTRPKVTQHVETGDQAAEFAEVASQKMLISGDTVTKATEAGYLDLSQQDIDWTDPAAMDLVLQDFANVYSKRMELRACDFLVASATTDSDWVIDTLAHAIKTFVDGFLAVYTTAEEPADTIWLDSGSWAALAQLSNTTEEVSAISRITEALSTYGVTPRWIVGRRFTGTVRIIGSSRLVESYEQTNGLLRVAQPDVLGQRVAYYGYVAFHAMPEGLVNLVHTP